MKSRNRGRRTAGGRVVLRGAVGGDVTLDEWELQALLRLVPLTLRGALRPFATIRDGATAQALADAIGAAHPLHPFFSRAAGDGGFGVERA
jgi:hypothetical protein